MSYAGNPNSTHQLWSFWTFDVFECGRTVPRKDVEYNAAKWLLAGFGSAGRIRVKRRRLGWRIETLVEGPPAHDPQYVESVRRGLARFVEQGWGTLSVGRLTACKVMAGDLENGKPRPQMIEMPSIGPER